MNLSYWEYKSWLSNIDFTIVGSGIVGLNCALQLRERFPSAKILILEKGVLPQGASTKNAGFACYGSISETIADLKSHTEQEVQQLFQSRWDGIQMLRTTLGDAKIGYKNYGGHEVFLKQDTESFENCKAQLRHINTLLAPVFGKAPFELQDNRFDFQKVHPSYISNDLEGQIDTGSMMMNLLLEAQRRGITILNSLRVQEFSESNTGVAVKTAYFEFKTKKLFVATNGFASKLINQPVIPARAQVLITKPIANLQIRGTFHLDQGYFYFRNIDNRILLGGGRNLDFKSETTDEFGQTPKIQDKLEEILRTIILPGQRFEIDRRWSGIMGVGDKKRPILKQISENVFCGVRLGGMGIAIGSYIGKELANLCSK